MSTYSTQNDLLMTNLLAFYSRDDNLRTMLRVVAGETRVSAAGGGRRSTNRPLPSKPTTAVGRSGAPPRKTTPPRVACT